MPKLLIQSKHEEFESNSALQIRNQKERRAENQRNGALQFVACEKLQGAKFRSLRNLLPAFVISCSVDPHLTHFCDFFNFSLHVIWVLRIFLYFFFLLI